MRYVVQHKKATYINFLVILINIAIYFFLALFIAFKFITNELFPNDLVLSLKGNPEEFLEPKSLDMVIEFMHIESFMVIVLLLTVISIFIRTIYNDKLKIYFSFILFLSAFLYFSSIFGVIFISETFAYINFLSFCILIFGTLIINTLNLYSFLSGKIK